MMRRDHAVIAVIGTYLIGLGTRLFPLWWSPLPATLDGLVYAQSAARWLAADAVITKNLSADAVTSTFIFSLTAAVSGVPPLRVSQPVYAWIGATTVLLGFVFARRLGWAWEWSAPRIRFCGALAAFALAVDGIFVRRTGVPDDDAITLLLIPLLVFVAYRYVETRRYRWYGVLVALMFVLPLTHTFSTLVAALAVTGFVALNIDRTSLGQTTILDAGTVAGFWIYFALYYDVAPHLGFTVPYVQRISAHPGLFVAWVIILILGVVWYQQTSPRLQRVSVFVPLALFFAVVAVNAAIAIYPGTSQTPLITLALVAPLAIPTVLAMWASPLVGRRHSVGAVLLALLAAPLVQTLFSLTAALTPDFAATAMRAQTHLHLPVLVLAAAAASTVVEQDSVTLPNIPVGARPIVASLLVIALVTTLPVAYINLDTGSFPSTITESEYESGHFTAATVPSPWTSSHNLIRIASTTGQGGGGTMKPTAIWLRGGPPPECPVLSAQSWTTTGAHLFPGAPASIAPSAYDQWVQQNDKIYAGGGYEPLAVTNPRGMADKRTEC